MGIRFAVVVVVLLQFISCTRTEAPIAAIFPTVDDTNNSCSMRNLKTFNHLTLDRSTGRIYIGGINRIIQLNSSLNLEACIITGPKRDSYDCHPRGCEGKHETTLMDNVNKILVLDKESGIMIACGSLFQGACQKYFLGSLSPKDDLVPTIVAANDERSSTYAFIGPERYAGQWEHRNVLYVGTTYTSTGLFREEVPSISSRDLDSLELAANTFTASSALRIEVKYRDHFLVKFVYGFNFSDYAYFVIVQKNSHLPGQDEQGHVTRLSRVCISDANYDSYTEVTLQCLVKKHGSREEVVNHNLVQDVKLASAGEDLAASLGIQPGDAILVASFSPSLGITNEPTKQSAVCVYSMKEIEIKFNENIHMCFNGSTRYRNMLYISGQLMNGDCPGAGVCT